MTTTMTTMMTTMQLKTNTRNQRLNTLLARPLPLCTSTEYKHEYYRLIWKLRELINCHPKDVRQLWMMNLLTDALNELLNMHDPTSTPTDSRKDDNRRWTDIMVRRTIVEQMWEEDESITFYDCYDALREGRSKAAQVRLYDQVRTCWETVTGTDLGTEFRIATSAAA